MCRGLTYENIDEIVEKESKIFNSSKKLAFWVFFTFSWVFGVWEQYVLSFYRERGK